MRKAIIIGATGLTGSECLRQLMDHPGYKEIHVLHYRNIECHDPKVTFHLVDFNNLTGQLQIENCHDIFCCIGTTRHKTPEKSDYLEIDVEIPIKTATWASENGTKNLLVISAIGANPKSIFFYNRIKGQLEERLKKIPIPGIHIFRPSLLLGKRNKNRTLESVGTILFKIFSFVLFGKLRKYKPVKAEKVASAMVKTALKDKKGYHIYESNLIEEMAISA